MTVALPGGLPPLFAWSVVVALAAVLGSFLNVCISRLPRGESIVSPPSHCPRCQTPIRYYDNIPLVSFALLGGRCRACREPIPWRYPVVEALAIGIGLLALWHFGPTWAGLRVFVLGLALVAVTFIDLETRLIPDLITLPGIVVGLLFHLAWGPWRVVDGLLGCVVAGGLFYLIAWLSELSFGREGMGGGDIKLAAMMGAFLGLGGVLVAIFLGVMAGGIMALGLLGFGLKRFGQYLAFGPFLAVGGLIAAFWAGPILDWYLG
ncbi:MAG TPA: prepilin peptidase [Methylomirabilota bacterium]|nr:prepilin peptidase [Methylomirabilota bacterium]